MNNVCKKCGDEYEGKPGWCLQCIHEAVIENERIRELQDMATE
jgi:hypothetical protein